MKKDTKKPDYWPKEGPTCEKKLPVYKVLKHLSLFTESSPINRPVVLTTSGGENGKSEGKETKHKTNLVTCGNLKLKAEDKENTDEEEDDDEDGSGDGGNCRKKREGYFSAKFYFTDEKKKGVVERLKEKVGLGTTGKDDTTESTSEGSTTGDDAADESTTAEDASESTSEAGSSTAKSESTSEKAETTKKE